MNIERMIALADLIASKDHMPRNGCCDKATRTCPRVEPGSFYMGEWHASWLLGETKCGTVACIAGFAAACAVEQWTAYDLSNEDIYHVARDWLELDDDEAQALFTPRDNPDTLLRGRSYRSVTPTVAAEVIRQFAEGYEPQEAWDNAFEAGGVK